MASKTFSDWAKDHGIKIPDGNIPSEWFSKNGLPMIVECKCCTTTMCVISAIIDHRGNTYCRDCAPTPEQEEIERCQMNA